MNRRSFEQRFRDKLSEYEKTYDLEFNTANDRANLHALITNTLIIEDLQRSLQDMINDQNLDPNNIEKTTQLIQKLLSTNQQLERQLSIDRKTRRASGADNLAEYIASLQNAARQFLEQRLIRVICPDCKVMVGRFAPVHEHTRYVIAFQCSQCSKMVSLERDERSVWFDLKPREYRWRKNFPVSIRHVRSKKMSPVEGLTDEVTGSQDHNEVVMPTNVISDPIIVIDDFASEDHGTDSKAE